jgi:hypothetical protein
MKVRKILLSVAQLQLYQKKIMLAAMGQVKKITKIKDDFMESPRNAVTNRGNNGGGGNEYSNQSEYPGKRTEKSVQECLEKMKKQQDLKKPENN